MSTRRPWCVARPRGDCSGPHPGRGRVCEGQTTDPMRIPHLLLAGATLAWYKSQAADAGNRKKGGGPPHNPCVSVRAPHVRQGGGGAGWGGHSRTGGREEESCTIET